MGYFNIPVDHVHVDKRHHGHNVAEVMNLIGDIKGKVVVTRVGDLRLSCRVAAPSVAGAYRVFLICFGVHYWYLGLCTSSAVVASGLLGAAVARHLSVTNLSAARRDALESTVIRIREGVRRKEQNCSSSSSEGCCSSVKRSSRAEAGQLGNSAAPCTGDINCWNNVDGIHSENSMDSGRPNFASRSSSCRSDVQESESGPSSMGKNVNQNSSLVVCSSSGLENQGYESSASNSLNPALDLSLALAFQEKLNDPRITSILKRRAAHGELELTSLALTVPLLVAYLSVGIPIWIRKEQIPDTSLEDKASLGKGGIDSEIINRPRPKVTHVYTRRPKAQAKE
ncbi:hypothetical protein F511_22382 [Dorcoceras hygrometricum]|uniref:Uncharacterized protein n=1 Tax=Dorcoceras hygrometricum TaxID=472368 RepID=A0A2Z7B6K5_9LAMI|nr:hypothetical protein F511_22382 [Dorcoceras hygrometricum]